MADVRATLRLFDEFLWVLRREGVAISPAEAIDAMRALRIVGLEHEKAVRAALEAILLSNRHDTDAFDRAWMQVFHAGAPPANLRVLLLEAGANEREVELVRQLLDRAEQSYKYLLETPGGGVHLAHTLASGPGAELVRGHRDAAREGAASHALAARAGISEAKMLARRWRTELSESVGYERAELLVRALERAADLAMPEIRRVLRAARKAAEARAEQGGFLRAPLDLVGEEDADLVLRAIRSFASRLKGRWHVRQRRARKGRVHLGRTLRRAWRTGGVPMQLAKRAKERRKPRLVLLCDVSESVRAHTRFMLEFVRAALELFDDARAYVFVREVSEVSSTLRARDSAKAVGEVLFGGLPASDNSNYGQAFAKFVARHSDVLNRETIVVVLGDGRSNHAEANTSALADIRSRIKALHWLCPESRERWGQGDSAIPAYLPFCTQVWEARTAEDILRAARALTAA